MVLKAAERSRRQRKDNFCDDVVFDEINISSSSFSWGLQRFVTRTSEQGQQDMRLLPNF